MELAVVGTVWEVLLRSSVPSTIGFIPTSTEDEETFIYKKNQESMKKQIQNGLAENEQLPLVSKSRLPTDLQEFYKSFDDQCFFMMSTYHKIVDVEGKDG